MNILFFIPARCGSKGIKDKNIYPLYGIPLISYSIMAIRKALPFFKKFENKIFVSTDCNKIAKISKDWGAEVPFLRSKNISQDKSDVIDAIFYSAKKLEKLNFKPDIIILIQPTSPLIEAYHIKQAFKLFKDKKKPIISITELEIPISWIFNLKGKNLKINEKVLHLRQKQRQKYYRPNGAIYISSLEDLKEYKSFYTEKTLGYLMDYENSIDIDSKEDLLIAEKILEYRLKKEKKRKVEILGRKIEEGKDIFFIAEAGVNHNGKLEIAKKLVDLAKEAGADAVKFQTFKTEKLVSSLSKKADYQLATTNPEESQFDMLKKLELLEKEFIELKEYCDKREIIFLSTPFDLESLEFLERLKVPAFKIGSGDLNNYFLLKEVAKKGKPIILSTGMAYFYEIFNSLELLNKYGNDKIVLLHCITNYPAKAEEANLNVIRNLKFIFRKPVGFSDHTLGEEVALQSLAFQPCIIEKHFTINKNMEGPDHKASLSPEELKSLINKLKNLRFSFGNGEKKLSKEEEKNRKIVRRSLFAKSFIPKGTIIKEEYLEALRPGNGMSPMEVEKILGKKTKFDIKKGEMIKLEYIERE